MFNPVQRYFRNVQRLSVHYDAGELMVLGRVLSKVNHEKNLGSPCKLKSETIVLL
jgi:hypothetical protein